ncbi:MAG: hypothetical protein PARBA_02019 [Parabacteroides sp.]
MKLLKFIGLYFIGSCILCSCSNEVESASEKQEQTIPETYTVSLGLEGDYISTSETPLSKAGETVKKKIYGINVYYKEDDESEYKRYAYGLFDNVEDMTISLISEYKYKFECTVVKEDEDILYCTSANEYDSPFGRGYQMSSIKYNKTYLANKFIVSTTSSDYFFDMLKYGRTCINSGNMASHPKMDRFYGELAGYTPSVNGKVNINLKRTVFALKFIVTPPSDGILNVDGDGLCNIDVSSTDNIFETESLYTFYWVYDCWKAENYSENFFIVLIWKRANGVTQRFEKTITVKRNVLTTVNISVNGSTADASIGFNEESTPMGNESVDMNFDGGSLEDNDVKPNE